MWEREKEKDRERERDRGRGREKHRQRDRKGEKCLGCMMQKSILDRSKNKDQSSN